MSDDILKTYEERLRALEADGAGNSTDDSKRQRLETLQKSMRDREVEITRIRAMLALLASVPTDPDPAPEPIVSQPPVAPAPDPIVSQPPAPEPIVSQPIVPQPRASETPSAYPPQQIVITQNFSSPAAPYPVQPLQENTAREKNEEIKPITVENIVKEGDSNEEEGGVMYRERLTFAESYVLLSPKQRKYCDGLRAYAAQKSGAKEFPAKYHLCVGNGQKVVIKFMIKNGVTITRFRLEDERLRRLRRSATSDDVEVKIKESEVPIPDDTAYEVAKQMIDLRLVQIAEDVELKKQRAAERRKPTKK